jgi:hypothetical protein
MIEIIQRLLAGDTNVVTGFVKCKKFWETFFEEHKADTDDELAAALTDAQVTVEHIFDSNRALGKQAMPLTCFGSLYDEIHGWNDPPKKVLAKRLANAFQKSLVSLEVKDYARDAAELYYVHD